MEIILLVVLFNNTLTSKVWGEGVHSVRLPVRLRIHNVQIYFKYQRFILTRARQSGYFKTILIVLGNSDLCKSLILLLAMVSSLNFSRFYEYYNHSINKKAKLFSFTALSNWWIYLHKSVKEPIVIPVVHELHVVMGTKGFGWPLVNVWESGHEFPTIF